MTVIDISRDLLSAEGYPGDPKPEREILRQIELGDQYNLSAFSTGCHSGTHIDAPLHYIADGCSIDQIPVERFMGFCTVVEAVGIVTGADIDSILPSCEKILLIKGEGKAFLCESAAFALADAGFQLVGTDALSIAPEGEEEARVHSELLQNGIPILEGLDLSAAAPGNYTLVALPVFIKGAEAAPARAVLIKK